MDMNGLMPMVMLALGVIGVGALMAFVLLAPSPGKAKKRRLKRLAGRAAGAATDAQLRRIQMTRATKVDDLFTRFLPNPALISKRLAMTGKSWTVGQYGMVSAGLLVVVSGMLIVAGAPILLALLLGVVVGGGVPHFVVGMFINKRVNKFNSKFPDAIELLVRGLRSGLPIAETMGVVGQEVDGPIGVEFRAITDKMKIGRSMDVALQETADRLGTPEFQFFCISINIQRETGGNLAETLANLANVLRQRAQMKLKIKAMSSESKASAYIVGSLPFIVFTMIWFINGTYMQSFFVDQRLMVAGIGGLIWMGIGAAIMAKMVNFEI
ncbi:type II secretion system F family protein [Sphingomonas sp.]|uniref:type II secretion system F family protein n=1 Tax=Sphingomonas sp. TaxID=28214 RepID=UPI001DB4020F|nr:type II secretion system F family protein [Sphingomonas sp.]MBX9797588.1 type II secretion system F family protein [Sphingomonas sp.]